MFPNPTPIVMPVTGVELATVARLLTVTLRSVAPDEYLTVNGLESTLAGCSVPVNVSVIGMGVGGVVFFVQLTPTPMSARIVASRAAVGSDIRVPLRRGSRAGRRHARRLQSIGFSIECAA